MKEKRGGEGGVEKRGYKKNEKSIAIKVSKLGTNEPLLDSRQFPLFSKVKFLCHFISHFSPRGEYVRGRRRLFRVNKNKELKLKQRGKKCFD